MSESLRLHSFGHFDRSAKVRWIASELGLEIDEARVPLGDHRKPPYAALNPLRQVPTVEFRGDVLFESNAILQTLAEAFDAPKLWIARGEPGRADYLRWLAIFGENLEADLVDSAISKQGILGPEVFAMNERRLRSRLRGVAGLLPDFGFLCGETFTVADIVAAYALNLARACDLVEADAISGYATRLATREGARRAKLLREFAV